jgi:hypothetical protein
MVLHIITFILLGLGGIYDSKLLAFGALVSLMVGLFFGKEALETADVASQVVEIIEEDDGFIDVDVHLVDVLRQTLD